jgi:hypothetical protein
MALSFRFALGVTFAKLSAMRRMSRKAPVPP